LVYSIYLTRTAKGQLNKIDKSAAKRIVKKLRSIAPDPFHYITRLAGSDIYKLRVGDYRVKMTIEKDKLIIIVIEVGHRRNIYKD